MEHEEFLLKLYHYYGVENHKTSLFAQLVNGSVHGYWKCLFRNDSKETYRNHSKQLVRNVSNCLLTFRNVSLELFRNNSKWFKVHFDFLQNDCIYHYFRVIIFPKLLFNLKPSIFASFCSVFDSFWVNFSILLKFLFRNVSKQLFWNVSNRFE